jgi:predicted nuclease of predicted toxin-antitoxin system
VGTLASELGSFAEALTDSPRVYCDANLPAGLIRFMRERLIWDVLFVLEEARLRRASDIEHFRLAAQLRRTLLTLDRDYLDDARFPPAEGAGVLVLSAPDQDQFERLLKQVDRVLFRPSSDHARPERVEGERTSDKRSGAADASRTPLLGRKMLVHTDWQGEMEQS